MLEMACSRKHISGGGGGVVVRKVIRCTILDFRNSWSRACQDDCLLKVMLLCCDFFTYSVLKSDVAQLNVD